jgi:hypothetical protein
MPKRYREQERFHSLAFMAPLRRRPRSYRHEMFGDCVDDGIGALNWHRLAPAALARITASGLEGHAAKKAATSDDFSDPDSPRRRSLALPRSKRRRARLEHVELPTAPNERRRTDPELPRKAAHLPPAKDADVVRQVRRFSRSDPQSARRWREGRPCRDEGRPGSLRRHDVDGRTWNGPPRQGVKENGPEEWCRWAPNAARWRVAGVQRRGCSVGRAHLDVRREAEIEIAPVRLAHENVRVYVAVHLFTA